MRLLGRDPWGGDIKASDDFLTPLFQRFFQILERPNDMNKTNFHVLAAFVPPEAIDDEIRRALDAIGDVVQLARPRVDS